MFRAVICGFNSFHHRNTDIIFQNITVISIIQNIQIERKEIVITSTLLQPIYTMLPRFDDLVVMCDDKPVVFVWFMSIMDFHQVRAKSLQYLKKKTVWKC